MNVWWLMAVTILLFSGCSPEPEVRQSSPGSQPSSSVSTPTTVNPVPRPVLGGEWKTDFSKASVPIDEIKSGGPPRDGIPPIDRPVFESPENARRWLKDREPVILVELQGVARAYPLQILIWHEIVNDAVGAVPVSVTFCPLCNTAIVFDRRLDGTVYDFGTTGRIRKSDLVMWDRQTESWWQQFTGEAIVGTLTGKKLTQIPASIVSFAEFRSAFPRGEVLSRDTGHDRKYGQNPYVGYDDIDSSPFLFDGKLDGRLKPMERVVTVDLNGQQAVYPFGDLTQRRIIEDEVGGRLIVVFHAGGTASALDQPDIATSRDIGATGVFEPIIDGQQLRFALSGDRIIDRETGSSWTVLGRAVDGPHAGKQLQPVIHGNHFWFAMAAFYPNARIGPGR